MQLAESRQLQRRRTLIKPLHQIKGGQVNNIFTDTLTNPETFEPRELHHVVGETAWKQTIYGQLLSKSEMSKLREQVSKHSFQKELKSQSFKNDNNLAMMTQKSNHSKFCLDQIDKESRERRVLQKYSQTQVKWKQTQKNILNSVDRNKSISFGAVKYMYLHPNPDKMTLINDNVPQYWQHSLRDNKKELKKHLRSNPFKKQVAEEMLQTLAGRNRLQKSIPQIQKHCGNISLKGKGVQGKRLTWNSQPSKFFDETLINDYSFKDIWLNEINCTQTITSNFTFN